MIYIIDEAIIYIMYILANYLFDYSIAYMNKIQ